MRNKTMQRVYVIVGIFLASLMGLTLFLPGLSPNNNQADQVEVDPPTATPPPTFPPPISDFSGITFDTEYLHPSGLFTVDMPSGWSANAPANNGVQAQANFENQSAVSVIVAFVEQRTETISSLEDLSSRFDTGALQSSWNQYRSWDEIGVRELNEATDRLTIEFQLTDGTNRTLFARQVAWYDDNYVYAVRVVVPSNAPRLLDYLTGTMPEHVHVNEQFIGTPISWTGYFDREDQHFLRFPSSWQVVDQAAGLPASIASSDGRVQVRVEARETQIADADAAASFVENLRSGAEIAGEPVAVERPGGAGFAVAYNFATPDGAGRSGLAVLLNGEDGQLHIANAIIEAAGVDLNSEEAAGEYGEVVESLGTFGLLTGLNLPEPAPQPTPTPFPTAAPTQTPLPDIASQLGGLTVPTATPTPTAAEVTAEATAEATEDAGTGD
jgi:hypothetical protein